MTATERAKRSDALYYETVSVNRRVLCDMVANREADLEDAKAENAALLEECDGWKKLCVDQEVMHVMHEDALDNEIAKLRELVKDMWACISHIGEYDAFYYDMAKDGCGISCTVNGEHCCADKLCNRMRELGVEVNG